MTTAQKFLIDKITEARNNAKNTYEKRIYNKQLSNIENGLCPYGCVDWKKGIENDKKVFLGRGNKKL